ncbi:hypothetical protein DW228_06335 [Bacteroides fragilis]|uniref:Uncharacterized protein n=1 Tax=Bacteroides fragilis TaxID=817 RepID=A0A396C1P3_BACFG|nr:hypothetical protein [Bacteroides fragilis]RHH14415.1 hypothetical protein DW228_06335 [Bacteroides fragilis]
MEDKDIYFEEEQESTELINLKARFYSVREEARNFILYLVEKHGGKIGSEENPISLTVEYFGNAGVTSGCIESISYSDITMEDKMESVFLSNLLVDPLICFSQELENYCKRMDKSGELIV